MRRTSFSHTHKHTHTYTFTRATYSLASGSKEPPPLGGLLFDVFWLEESGGKGLPLEKYQTQCIVFSQEVLFLPALQT